MPLDAISLRAVVEELRPQLLNLRIDKVQQPGPGSGDLAAAGQQAASAETPGLMPPVSS